MMLLNCNSLMVEFLENALVVFGTKTLVRQKPPADERTEAPPPSAALDREGALTADRRRRPRFAPE